MTSKATKACLGLLLAVACLLAATGTVEASRMGAMRGLSQSRGVAGVYSHNGEGIVIVNTVRDSEFLHAPGCLSGRCCLHDVLDPLNKA